MKKCKRCGASFLTHYRVRLKDADICRKCFVNDLGFSKNLLICSDIYSYDDIKDGYDEYVKRDRIHRARELVTIEPVVEIHGLEKDLICTEEERSVFNCIENYFFEHDIDGSSLELVRYADAYLTIRFMERDLARFKYTIRAKWITFPMIESRNDHHAIDFPDKLSPALEDLLDDAISKIIEWNEKQY